MDKVLLGIIVDVSSSMQKNWGRRGIKKSKIEAVKEAINQEITRITTLNSNEVNEKLKTFCLGIGFRLELGLISYDVNDGIEKEAGGRDTVLIGIICDILALSNYIPSQKKLLEIKEYIRGFWNKSADEFLGDIQLNNAVHIELEEYLYKELISLYSNTDNKLLLRLFSLLKKVKILYRKDFVENRSKLLSKKYSEAVKERADEIFNEYKAKYEKFIENKISDFAENEVFKILERNTLGFSIETILDHFDKSLLQKLSEDTYTEIKVDLRKEFKSLWVQNRLDLWVHKFKYLSKLDIGVLSEKTEQAIRNIGWNSLKPFVEEIVFSIFREAFTNASEKMIKRWITLSTKSEVIKSLNNLDNIFPNSDDSRIYTEEYMFGGTPMFEAINMATLRFNKIEFNAYRKILLIISDGEYENVGSVDRTIELLKNSGVTIACGYISERSTIDKFRRSIRSNAKVGAKNLMRISSSFNEAPELVKLIEEGEIETEEDNKLCIQLNQPENINLILKGVLEK